MPRALADATIRGQYTGLIASRDFIDPAVVYGISKSLAKSRRLGQRSMISAKLFMGMNLSQLLPGRNVQTTVVNSQ